MHCSKWSPSLIIVFTPKLKTSHSSQTVPLSSPSQLTTLPLRVAGHSLSQYNHRHRCFFLALQQREHTTYKRYPACSTMSDVAADGLSALCALHQENANRLTPVLDVLRCLEKVTKHQSGQSFESPGVCLHQKVILCKLGESSLKTAVSKP